VNTEDETEFASVFQIQSIPSLLFIPMEGLPTMQLGALPRKDFLKKNNWPTFFGSYFTCSLKKMF
jgi:hypothetical protein